MEKTQQDIVNRHLQSLRVGEVLQDKLHSPNLDKLFVIKRPKGKPAVRQERLRLPLTGKIADTTRDEIAQAIVDCTKFGQDITAITWQVGDDYLEVVRENGAAVALAEGYNESVLHGILLNALRFRASVQGFSWEFGKPFLTISFENRQYA